MGGDGLTGAWQWELLSDGKGKSNSTAVASDSQTHKKLSLYVCEYLLC